MKITEQWYGDSTMRHIVPISGKDSLATALVVRDLLQITNVEYIYNDVGADIPDVENWLSSVETNLLHTKIHRIGESLEDIILDQGILPSFRSRFCTRMAKIYPMEDYLGKSECIVYFGIRADENRDGYRATKKNITPNYPLQTFGIGLKEVYKLIDGYEPPTFFWKTLYDKTAEYTNIEKLIALPDYITRQLFSWRTRMNCYFCFFQRQYEWIGLLDHYPTLFEKAVWYEENIGAKGFNWNPSKSLRTMQEQREMIINKRAKKIAKWVNNQAELLENEDGYSELINVVSCGLLCGK